MGSKARLQLQMEAARKYTESGISVIPIKEGSKFPDRKLLAQAGGSSPRGFASLAPFQKRKPTEMEMQVWFSRKPINLAVVIGYNDLYALDFDDEKSYWIWVDACPDYAEKVPIQKSAKGYHVFFRSAHLTSSRYRTFLPAYLLGASSESRIASLETLGQWVLTWPSMHPDGKLYQWMPGKTPWETPVPMVYDLSSLNLRIERLKPGLRPFVMRCFANPKLARIQWGHYRRQRYGEVEG